MSAASLRLLALLVVAPCAFAGEVLIEQSFDIPSPPVAEGSLGAGNWEVTVEGANAGAGVVASAEDKTRTHLLLTNRLDPTQPTVSSTIFAGVSVSRNASETLRWTVRLRADNIAPRSVPYGGSLRGVSFSGVVLAASSPKVASEGEGVLLVLSPGRILELWKYTDGFNGSRDLLAEDAGFVEAGSISNALTLEVTYRPTDSSWTVAGVNHGAPAFPTEDSAPSPVFSANAAFPSTGDSFVTGFFVNASPSATFLRSDLFRLSGE